MRSDEADAHSATHKALKTNRRFMRDLYAMQLFTEERYLNPLRNIDTTHSWQQLTREDRDIYRNLADRLVTE